MMEAERRRLQVPYLSSILALSRPLSRPLLRPSTTGCRYRFCRRAHHDCFTSTFCCRVLVCTHAFVSFFVCGVALLQLAMEVLEMEELKMFAEVEEIHSRSSLKDMSSRREREIGQGEGPGTAVPVVAANPFAAPSFLAELEEKKKTLRKSRASQDNAPIVSTTSDREEGQPSARGDYSARRVTPPPPLSTGGLDAPQSSQLEASMSSSLSALVAQANDEKLAAWRQFIHEVSRCPRHSLPHLSPSPLSPASPSPLSHLSPTRSRAVLVIHSLSSLHPSHGPCPNHSPSPLSRLSLPPLPLSGPRGAPGDVRGRRDRGRPAGPGQERRRVRRRGIDWSCARGWRSLSLSPLPHPSLSLRCWACARGWRRPRSQPAHAPR